MPPPTEILGNLIVINPELLNLTMPPTPDDNPHHDDAYFAGTAARGASADPFGKLDAMLDPVRMDFGTIEKLTAEAHKCGVSLAEFIRTVLRARVWGVDHVQSLQANRAALVMGNVGEMHSGAEGGGK